MHKQRAAATAHLTEFSEKEPTDSLEGCKRRIRRDLGTHYTPGAVTCEPFCGLLRVAHALAREGKRFENPLALDERYDLTS